MKTLKITLSAIAIVSLLVFTAANSYAATMSISASAPATSPPDFVNFGSGNGETVGLTDDYGQTFTTGSNAGGYTLNSITVQQSAFGLNGPSGGTVSVGTLSGTTYTALYSEAYAAVGGFYADDYFTYTFASPYSTLAPNTTYAFELQGDRLPNVLLNALLGSNTSFTLAEALGTTNTVTLDGFGRDLSFSLDLVAIPAPLPEPSTLVLAALGLVGLAAGRRRRR